MNKPEYKAKGIWPNTELKGCTILIPEKGRWLFIKDETGAVYYAMQHKGHHLDMAGEWMVNDAARKAYCRLAGIKSAEMKAAIKAYKAHVRRMNEDQEEIRLRLAAKKRGFKLVRVRA